MPPTIVRDYQQSLIQTILDLSQRNNWWSTSINLGGGAGGGGGSGVPVGDIYGQLIQSKVAFDTTEAASLFIPASGVSLLHNLNRIRYRIESLEASGVGASGISIQHDDATVGSDTTILNFEGDGVTDVSTDGPGKVTVTISGIVGSGGSGPHTLGSSTHTDVTITSVQDENLLEYDSGSGDWINVAGAKFAGSGHLHDELVKVSSNDTTANYLENKIVAGTNVTVTTLNEGANETVEITSTGSGGGGSALEVFDEGITLTSGVTSLDFVGGGVTATASGTAVTVTVPSGTGGSGPPLAVTSGIFYVEEVISELTLTTTSGIFSVSDIPQTYDSLRLEAFARTDRPSNTLDAIHIRFNGDTGTNYSFQRSEFESSTGYSEQETVAQIQSNYVFTTEDAPSNSFGSARYHIPNYTSAEHKVVNSIDAGGRPNSGNKRTGVSFGVWRNTSAVTQIDVIPANGPDFMIGSTFRLIGIRNQSLVTEVTGGGAASAGSYWEPLAKPETSSAYDDEFDDNSFDTGLWTEFDIGALQTISEGGDGLTLSQATNPGDDLTGIYQTIPAGDFTIVTKASLRANASDTTYAGLALWDDATSSTADMNLVAMTYHDTGMDWVCQRWNDYQTFGTGLNGILNSSSPQIYVRIRRNGTTYSFDVGDDGIAWVQLVSTTLTFTPNEFGLFTNNKATGYDSGANFPFFRYVDSDLGLNSPVEGRRVAFWNI